MPEAAPHSVTAVLPTGSPAEATPGRAADGGEIEHKVGHECQRILILTFHDASA